MDTAHLTPTWRTSSYSTNQNSACVEVRPGHMVDVRDTKNRADGTLHVTPVTWRAFVTTVTAR